MATFLITRGDTSPALLYELPADVDLTGATAVLTVRGVLTRAPATIGSLVPPRLRYDWQPADTDAPSRVYRAEFEVTFPGGRIETFPTGDVLAVSILIDLG